MFGFEIFGIETINRGAGRVNQLRAAFEGAPSTILRQVGDRVLEGMQTAIPVAEEDDNWNNKGREHARDLLEFHIRGGDEGEFSGPGYLQYVIQGSDEHVIDTSPAVMAFFIQGESVVTRQVDIPARAANDFRIAAWDDSRDDAGQIVHDVGMKIIRGEALE